jgi:acyl-CoA thioesterase YciA
MLKARRNAWLFSFRTSHIRSSIPPEIPHHRRDNNDNAFNCASGRTCTTHTRHAADTNANGDIFGGWLMSQMDMGGAIQAKEIAHGRVVTVRVDGMTFLRPVAVGDVVCCYARCVKRGNTSITINVEVWVKKVMSEPIGQRYKATEALFIYVAVDNEGKPRPLPA